MSLFRIRAKRRENGETKTTKKTIATNVFMILLLLGSIVAVPIFEAKLVAGAPPDIKINPDAPEGVKEGGQKVAGFVFWVAWLAIFIVGAIGVLFMLGGKRQTGIALIALALIGAIIVANWTGIVSWFG